MDLIEDNLANYKQAYKDALFMEGEIEKKTPQTIEAIEEMEQEWAKASNAYKIVVGDCQGCGHGLIKMKHGFECSNCKLIFQSLK